MVSTCKNSMQLEKPASKKKTPTRPAQPPAPDEIGEKELKAPVDAKADSKTADSPKKKQAAKKNTKAPARKKRVAKKAPSKNRAKSPEDAILQSNAVEPDIEKAVKPKKRAAKKSTTKKTTSKKTKK